MAKEKYFEVDGIEFFVSGLNPEMMAEIAKDHDLKCEGDEEFCEFTKTFAKPVFLTAVEIIDRLALSSDYFDQYFKVFGAVYLGSSFQSKYQ
jgi:hypothetical protein